MKVAILIPAGGPWCVERARALEWILDYYRSNHPQWDRHVGMVGEPWSKGTAVDSAKQATEADVFVIADADSFVAPEHLNDAVVAAVRFGWAMPHSMVFRLSARATDAVYADAKPNLLDLDRGAYRGVKGGGILAITRDAYDMVGGIDPRFEGWGGEDVSLNYALCALVSSGARFAGNLIHLWHPHPAPNLRGSPAAEALVARYLKARSSPHAIRALIAERTEVPA